MAMAMAIACLANTVDHLAMANDHVPLQHVCSIRLHRHVLHLLHAAAVVDSVHAHELLGLVLILTICAAITSTSTTTDVAMAIISGGSVQDIQVLLRLQNIIEIKPLHATAKLLLLLLLNQVAN